MQPDEPGRRALEHIDRVIARRPDKDDHALSAATMCLAEFRDRLVAGQRQHGLQPAQRKQLAHVNAAITIVLGIHFPLGEVPWEELEKARDWIAEAASLEERAA